MKATNTTEYSTIMHTRSHGCCSLCNARPGECDCAEMLERLASGDMTELERWNANNRLNNRARYSGIQYCQVA